MPDQIPEGITGEDVLRGIKDFKDNVPHRFKDSISYDLLHDGKRFPPKAILGLAAKRLNGKPLTPDDFKGGDDSKCFRILRDLGFTIVLKEGKSKTKLKSSSVRNPDWSRDELIITVDFYLKFTPKIPGKGSAEISQLSKTLKQLHSKLGNEVSDTFRNVNGVYMKLMNLRRFDPSYDGKGLKRGGSEEEHVWNEFADDPVRLENVVNQIISHIQSDDELPPAEVIPDDEEEGEEGQVLSRVHRYRERDTRLVKKKKSQFLKKHGLLFCECCGFDFSAKYGERGDGFIECHHTKPVSELDVGSKTKLSDLSLVCSNCHRIIHRRKPWLSMDQLQSITVTGSQ